MQITSFSTKLVVSMMSALEFNEAKSEFVLFEILFHASESGDSYLAQLAFRIPIVPAPLRKRKPGLVPSSWPGKESAMQILICDLSFKIYSTNSNSEPWTSMDVHG